MDKRDWEQEGRDLLEWLQGCGVKTKGKTLTEAVVLVAEATDAKSADLVPAEKEAPTALNLDQEAALAKLREWTTTSDPYFVLKGYAGTGKTYLMKVLNQMHPAIYFTATTNKAAKVLGESVGKLAKTTYSLLGLRMVEEDDRLVLRQAEHPPHLPRGSIIVIDECSMVGQTLLDAVEDARKRCNLKVIYVGDPAQLPPVGELRSPAWKLQTRPESQAFLRRVMRNDSALLEIATTIRKRLKEGDWRTPLTSKLSKPGIVVFPSQEAFVSGLHALIDGVVDIGSGPYNPREDKVVAWRNRTVDTYNIGIRKKLGFLAKYCVGDVLLLAEPIERNGQLIAHTDDEFTVAKVEEGSVGIPTDNGSIIIEVWELSVTGDQDLVLYVPMRSGSLLLQEQLNTKANVARRATGQRRVILWREFWDVRRQFNAVRYGYAMTAHRAQGSTYRRVFVDQHDILANHESREAFRCLYVACTRPTTELITY